MVRILMPNGVSISVSPSLTVEEAIKICITEKFSSQNDYSLVFFGRKLDAGQRLADIPQLDESHSVRLVCRRIPGAGTEMNRAEVDKLRSQCRTLYQNLGEELQQKLETYMVDGNNSVFNSILKDHSELLHDSMAISIVKDLRLLVPAILENNEFAYEHPVCAKILKKTLLQFGIMQKPSADSFMAQGPFAFPGHQMHGRTRQAFGGTAAGMAPTPPGQPVTMPTTQPTITHDMLSQALNLALGGDASSAGPSASAVQQQLPIVASSPAIAAPSSVSVPQNSPQFAAQLDQLHEFGFTNDSDNAQVLAMTDGDVEQALQILITMREDN